MKKRLSIFILTILSWQYLFAQTDTAITNDIKRFREEILKEYSDPKLSPIKPDSEKKFKGIHFFPVSMDYVVTASFTRTPDEKIFDMPTSGTIKKQYVKYGKMSFTLSGKQYSLSVYQSVDLSKKEGYKNYVFIPFRDATSGKETYGAGRYLDLTLPFAEKVTLNFNKAYHPYCAYTDGYNCPIPPPENYLPVKVLAGVKM